MANILKPYTIIPAELYVKRDADRQLLNIIEDMGRPGYVLVSRQMGKTNLLLNLKREAETPDDIFVYIDLSNPFASAKDCFENIIDTILEIHGDSLIEVENSIKNSRKELKDIPAHKQHVAELREIIKAIKGKLVIILDEIDALTKTNYSDRIFSQIRSIYFTRVNFPELERLTYVLSGVVEPAEIIKDQKISPFNIGQKIFLNDFVYEEFIDFVEKAKLVLNDELLKHIYKWTSGNPRITWDVCSEVESNLGIIEISKGLIDKIIKELYLTNFDRPPIDNIRDLIKTDSELRNSIVEIEYNQGEKISDRIKSKLYLAGIINYTNGNIKLKNEVIRQSLNLEWINSIIEEEKGLTKIALEYFEKGDFEQCYNLFIKYLKNNSFSNEEKSLYYYYLGYSAYRTSKLEEALKYLNRTEFDSEDDTKFYYLTKNLKGLLYYYLDDVDSSLEHFKSVLSRSKKDEIFARALVNFGSISLKSNSSIHINEAKEIFKEIIEEKSIDVTKIDKELIDELKSISYYNLAQIELEEKVTNSAIQYYEKAIDYAPLKTKPKIILGLVPVVKSEEEKNSLLSTLVDIIEKSGLIPQEFDPDKPMNFAIEQFQELVIHLFSVKNKTLFNKIKHGLKNIGTGGLSQNLYDISLYCINKNMGLEIALDLLNDIYENKNNPDYGCTNEAFYKTIKLMAYFSHTRSGLLKIKEYIELFQKERFGEIDFIDIENFANYIYTLIEQEKYKEALLSIDIINSYKKSVSEQYLINFLVIHNLELNVHLSLSDIEKSKEIAERILLLANDDVLSKHKSNLLGKEGLSIIKSNAESILKPELKRTVPIRVEKKIGRNDVVRVRYNDGREFNIKYKKVENDIKSNLCVMIK